MIDTNKLFNTLSVFVKNEPLSSSDVAELTQNSQSLVTIKRQLTSLKKAGYLKQSGAGRSVKYTLSKKGILRRPIDTKHYLNQPPDKRLNDHHFQFSVLEPPHVELFSPEELKQLDNATQAYRNNAIDVDKVTHNKELLRFIVEFSWKTSEIEGNTYDLISTERLLLYAEKSPEHTEFEAQMILNQKQALEFVIENPELWQSPKLSTLEELHKIIGLNLGITKNLRRSIVGITGTNYRPLESEFQIKDALKLLFDYTSATNNIYEKALLAVLGISYIQPFVDGNKRTSRLLSNAILLSENYAPLSYRSVGERDYKEATLIFYEQNSIEPFKKLFVEQYVFAANNYNIARTD